MWAQTWDNIFDLVVPYPEVESVDVTSSLLRANYSVLRMFREAESFFTSVGLEPMTSDFWNKSMFVRPNDGRQVSCHGAAYDFHTETDFRYDGELQAATIHFGVTILLVNGCTFYTKRFAAGPYTSAATWRMYLERAYFAKFLLPCYHYNYDDDV